MSARRRAPCCTADSPNGSFTLEATPTGSVGLRAERSGLLTSKRRTVEVPESGRVDDVLLELGVGQRLTGVVRWPDGQPGRGV